MPKLLTTVQNLVDNVRAMIDEANTDSVDDVRDILPALNRALEFAADIYARRYPEPFLAYTTLDLVGGTSEYPIPEGAWEDRVLKVEIGVPSPGGRGTYREVQRISYRDLSNYESASLSNIPYYYTVIGRHLRFLPTPSGTYDARIWYMRSPEKLVKPQGRITAINRGARYVIVDSPGDDLTTESDQLGSFVNWVDGQTGEIKATLQIVSVQESRINFREVPAEGRSTVLNRTVVGELPADGEKDDYLCAVDGICVPYYGQPTCNFMVAYAAAEIATLKLGGESGASERLVEKFEQQVERTWVGREKQMRVSKRSHAWGVPTRRYYWT